MKTVDLSDKMQKFKHQNKFPLLVPMRRGHNSIGICFENIVLKL